LDHPQPPELRTWAVYTRQSVKTKGDLTSCEVQRQVCVDFVGSAECPAYRLLDQRFDDNGESGVELRIAAMPELAGGAFDTLLLNLLRCFAEFERELIASRISDRRAGLISRGRRIAGRTPYGYSADRVTKQLIPRPEEAAIVRELFGLISSGVPPSPVASAPPLARGRRCMSRS
jgi:DNA invertase Pin-like site-specific DNA recombinase